MFDLFHTIGLSTVDFIDKVCVLEPTTLSDQANIEFSLFTHGIKRKRIPRQHVDVKSLKWNCDSRKQYVNEIVKSILALAYCIDKLDTNSDINKAADELTVKIHDISFKIIGFYKKVPHTPTTNTRNSSFNNDCYMHKSLFPYARNKYIRCRNETNRLKFIKARNASSTIKKSVI